jgi:hypothetical protein
MRRIQQLLLSVSFLLFNWGCGSSIALFDQYAYTQATSIKVNVLNVMDHAVDEYSAHQQEIMQVNTEIQKMIEYEKHRPKDSITTRMWQLMNDPGRHLYGGFIVRWKKQGHLRQAAIVDAKVLIGLSFDQIAELESGKLKPSQLKNQR